VAVSRKEAEEILAEVKEFAAMFVQRDTGMDESRRRIAACIGLRTPMRRTSQRKEVIHA